MSSEITKIRQLLAHDEPEQREAGMALALALGDWSQVIEGCTIDTHNGAISVPFGPVNGSILKLILTAPRFDPSAVSVLDLSDCDRLETIESLPLLTGLTHLIISGCVALDEGGSDMFLPLGSLSTLETLYISSESISAVDELNGLDKLVHLTLESCPLLDDLESIGWLGALKTLHVTNCPGLSDLESIQWAFEDRTDETIIEELSITQCEQLEDFDGLRFIPSLKRLSLSGCGPSDGSAFANLSFLESLSCLETLEITDLPRSCRCIPPLPVLVSLQLTHSQLRDLKVVIGSTLPRLTELSLANSYELTSLQGLEGLSALRQLDLTDCPKIDPDEVRIYSTSSLTVRGL